MTRIAHPKSSANSPFFMFFRPDWVKSFLPVAAKQKISPKIPKIRFRGPKIKKSENEILPPPKIKRIMA